MLFPYCLVAIEDSILTCACVHSLCGDLCLLFLCVFCCCLFFLFVCLFVCLFVFLEVKERKGGQRKLHGLLACTITHNCTYSTAISLKNSTC